MKFFRYLLAGTLSALVQPGQSESLLRENKNFAQDSELLDKPDFFRGLVEDEEDGPSIRIGETSSMTKKEFLVKRDDNIDDLNEESFRGRRDVESFRGRRSAGFSRGRRSADNFRGRRNTEVSRGGRDAEAFRGRRNV